MAAKPKISRKDPSLVLHMASISYDWLKEFEGNSAIKADPRLCFMMITSGIHFGSLYSEAGYSPGAIQRAVQIVDKRLVEVAGRQKRAEERKRSGQKKAKQ